MTKSISMIEMLESRVPRSYAKSATVIPDTNSWKYNYHDITQRTIITRGVIDELSRYSEVFPDEHVKNLGDSLNPDVVTPFISPRDEYLIGLAAKQRPKSSRKVNVEIGWADTELIGLGLEEARKGNKTVIISNDGDILNTVKQLKKYNLQETENLAAVSVQRYIEGLNSHRLKGLEKPFRRAFLEQIDLAYRVAA